MFSFLSVEIKASFVLSTNLSYMGFAVEMVICFSSSFVSSTWAMLGTAVRSGVGFSFFSSSYVCPTGAMLGIVVISGVDFSLISFFVSSSGVMLVTDVLSGLGFSFYSSSSSTTWLSSSYGAILSPSAASAVLGLDMLSSACLPSSISSTSVTMLEYGSCSGAGVITSPCSPF